MYFDPLFRSRFQIAAIHTASTGSPETNLNSRQESTDYERNHVGFIVSDV